MNSEVLHIAEFFSISFIVIVVYIGIHISSKHIKPATKFLISMFLGTTAYVTAKLILIALVIEPFFTTQIY